MTTLAFSNETDTLFAELILPVPVEKLYTYRVPAALNDRIKPGQRVIVQFGPRRILTGLVHHLHPTPPRDYEAKYILDILDEQESVYEAQFRLYQWMADYYLCTLGEVMNAALPSGLKLSSESMVQLHPHFDEETTSFDFSEKEHLVLTRLKQESLSYSELAKLIGAKTINLLIKSLVSKEAIILFEQVKEKYKPKTEKRIRLTKKFTNKRALEALFETLTKRPQQEALLLGYLQLVPVFSDASLNAKGLAKAELMQENASESALHTLIKNGVLEEYTITVPRFGFTDGGSVPPLLLSESQEQARNSILQQLAEKNTVLFQGVTGSGKTEIYIDLIRRALEGGNQVLYLLPEIALTTQIVIRLKKVFGSALGVYHSRFSDNERVEVWNDVRSGRVKFVVGVRSSIFLPFDNLGLIIVDEEHDQSYKQQDPAPRYHARDVALMLGHQHGAKVILGSATPSVESFYQATAGKFGHVKLLERFGVAQLPEITFADTALERKSKTIKGDFTRTLLSTIRTALEQKEQVILFQNRRGYSPLVQCQDCSWTPTCIHCAVSLTYHQHRHSMICHYCGYRENLPAQCPTCSSRRILTLGYGTEKLEEELKLHFPEATIDRMDLDTTRTKSGYEEIITAFEEGSTDILVGTQMVTKGLDFNNVQVVGIFDADRLMHFPDFRSYERAFQLILQVSGRAGRREKKGLVVIQTANPRHPLFQRVADHDVMGFLEEQVQDRWKNHYPPFFRLIEITCKHIDPALVRAAATQLANLIRIAMEEIVLLGPAEPMVSRIRNEYLQHLLLKIPRDQGQLAERKVKLRKAAEQLVKQKEFRSVKVVFDVDPV